MISSAKIVYKTLGQNGNAMKPILYQESSPYVEYKYKFPVNNTVKKLDKSTWVKMKRILHFWALMIGIRDFK